MSHAADGHAAQERARKGSMWATQERADLATLQARLGRQRLDALPWDAAQALLHAPFVGPWTEHKAKDAVSTEADYLYSQDAALTDSLIERRGLRDPRKLAQWVAESFLGDLQTWLDEDRRLLQTWLNTPRAQKAKA